jgi:hypothetical protein
MWVKIKCFFGFHDWEYSDPVSYSDNIIHVDRIRFPTRFCQCCFKKQIRSRYDMQIFWTNSDKLTPHEIRQKKLKKLLND